MLKFYIKNRRNPITKDVKYYAQLMSPEPLNIDAISKMIAQNCTLTRHDILACLSAFQEQIINALQQGKSVRLRDLGSFRVTLHSLGANSESEFTTSHIKSVRIRFTPAARLRKAMMVGAEGIYFSMVGKNATSSTPQGPAVGE